MISISIPGYPFPRRVFMLFLASSSLLFLISHWGDPGRKRSKMITRKLSEAKTSESNSMGRNIQMDAPISWPTQQEVWLIAISGPLILTVDISDKNTPIVMAPSPIPTHWILLQGWELWQLVQSKQKCSLGLRKHLRWKIFSSSQVFLRWECLWEPHRSWQEGLFQQTRLTPPLWIW